MFSTKILLTKKGNRYYGKINKETKKTIRLDSAQRYIRIFGNQIDVILIEIIKTDGILKINIYILILIIKMDIINMNLNYFIWQGIL